MGCLVFDSFQNHSAFTLSVYFCGLTSLALETALLSARCIYWLLFKKTPKQSLCSRLYRYPNRPKPFRMQMLIFQPSNILKTPVENRCRSLKKQRGFKRWLCTCIKIAPPIDFSSFVCYLRQLNFAKARDFAIHTESNFSYCVKFKQRGESLFY